MYSEDIFIFSAISEMNEKIQGLAEEQDLPQSKVSPHGHVCTNLHTHTPI